MSVILPPIPTNPIVQQGNGQVFVTWSQISGCTYSVQRSIDNITYTEISTPTVPQYLDTDVTQGTQYFYKVASVNGQGTSSYTSALNIVPAQSGLLSLSQVRLMAQQRADRVGSDFVTSSEWNGYINQAYFELYDLLVTVYEDYFAAEPIITSTDGILSSIELPNGINYDGAKPFYKLLGIDCGVADASNAWVTLHKFDFIRRNDYIFPNLGGTYLGVFNLRYRVMGDKVQFIPTPSSGQFLRLWYIPRLATLLQDTDLLDGINGWTEYVIVRAAKYALDKEESDTQNLTQEIVFLKKRIEESAMNRDAGAPDTISNTRSQSSRYGGAGWDGSFGGYMFLTGLLSPILLQLLGIFK